MRLAVPLLILAVLTLTVIGELTYRRADATLTGGINLTDARIGAAKLLQLLTDAETAQRGYLLTGNADYIAPLRNAQRQFAESTQFLEFIKGLGASGPADAQYISTSVAAKFAELDRTIELAQSGQRAQALALVQSDSGKRLMDELRTHFKVKLEAAALLQQGARDRIYAALRFNRLAVFVLACILTLGLLLHLQQSRSFERGLINYQRMLEKEVAEKAEGLRTLAAWLETAREDEKSHLARELHDELGGLLTAAKLTAARMRGKLAGDPEMMERIESLNRRLDDGIALKRRIIEDLRPSALSLFGLHVALSNLCAEASQQLGIEVKSEIAEVPISPEAQLTVFRVAQEALTNIGKYANATEVSVRLAQVGAEVHLEVTDNGCGFTVGDQDVGRHGLAGMRFRMESLSGSLSVIAAPRQGVRILATMPAVASVPPATPAGDPSDGPADLRG